MRKEKEFRDRLQRAQARLRSYQSWDPTRPFQDDMVEVCVLKWGLEEGP